MEMLVSWARITIIDPLTSITDLLHSNGDLHFDERMIWIEDFSRIKVILYLTSSSLLCLCNLYNLFHPISHVNNSSWKTESAMKSLFLFQIESPKWIVFILLSLLSMNSFLFSMEITECGRANAERMDLIH